MSHSYLYQSLIGLAGLLCCLLPCSAQDTRVVPGDERTEIYLPMLEGKRVAVFSNHTGVVNGQHLLDLLLEEGVDVTAIFSPEHGFRGGADAGAHVDSSADPQTGIPILSLYDGKSRKPSAATMRKFDLLLVDIQDVGLRFYTYYITLCRLMDACAEHGRRVVILDRPNPNGHYVDGPLLDMKLKSGVGWLPIPIVHGMTLGELARMVNGERWLPQGRVCPLTVVPCLNYTHQTRWELPIAPSPNLPDKNSVYHSPSPCLFEGTPVSLGRGTDRPFQVYGHPRMKGCSYSFTPVSRPGAKNPPLEGQRCWGVDLSRLSDEAIWQAGVNLHYVIDANHRMGQPEGFFRRFFDQLAGVDYVSRMIKEGKRADEIKACWAKDVEQFKRQRRPYLLYEE